MRVIVFCVLVIVLVACSENETMQKKLFTEVAAASGITFSNNLTFTPEFNPYTYRNFYNGAGVGVGDINNDGLLDIYFAGNQTDNKLYLNQGNFKFTDITNSAGVACTGSWSTGVTMADVNADGLLDIYVCKSGSPDGPNRANELFINNGDKTFTEKSKEYGLDIIGLSVQSAFFDYDKDGDLDCYLLSNSFKSIGNYDLVKDQRTIPDSAGGGNKFLLNQGGKFIDHSATAGIYRSNIGFGLGITLGDFNDDSWTDIFVSNDFFERDYLYINNKKGGFEESLTTFFESISMGSMGADLADLDNDGVAELFVTEMLPDSLNRKKTKTIFESWNKYELNVRNGYHHQFSRNVLQTRSTAGNYLEVGRLAGISATEWSWGALLFDMDNDGLRDIFVANGIYKDLLDRDYLTYTANDENIRNLIRVDQRNAIVKLINSMPSSQFPNYAFHNEGALRFKNLANEFGLGQPSYSSGSAYGDLDNDGDIDLVISNINAPASLFRNNTDTAVHKSISLSLSSSASHNKFAVGAQVTAYANHKSFYADNFVTRGFQSSVQPRITIGLGDSVTVVDSLMIRWPEGGVSIHRGLAVNQNHSFDRKNAKIQQPNTSDKNANSFFAKKIIDNIFRHTGGGLNDFNRERLLPMMYSNETPAMSKADFDGDGVNEIMISGGKDQPSSIISFKSGIPEEVKSSQFLKYSQAEKSQSAVADVDGDGDLDLYMAMGGRFFSNLSTILFDKIFLNDGKGKFSESPHRLPYKEVFATSVVQAIDFDRDGDQDFVVGERGDPTVYGKRGTAYLLENNGEGKFIDVTSRLAAGLVNIGMVTDIEVTDIDTDGWSDLVIVGDWMPVVMLRNTKGAFLRIDEVALNNSEGWWHNVESADLNKDGKPDFIIANHGLNTFFKSFDRMYVGDFDQNGSIEQIFCTKVNDKYFPITDKDELLSQLPSFKKSLLYYKDYGSKSIDELMPANILRQAKVYEVKELSSVLLLSHGKGYERIALPKEAQYSPVYGLSIADFDNDGIEDVIAGGNQFAVKPQFGRYDASNGWFFKGALNSGKFLLHSGVDLNVKGQIRSIEYVEVKGSKFILFGKYDDALEIRMLRN